jgi:hypothetical protein
MKALSFLLCLVLTYTYSTLHAQTANVAFFEHSIRWTNESSFPYYLKLDDVSSAVMSGVKESLIEKFAYNSVGLPGNIDYRVIDMFGKAKVKWPRTAAAEDEVAILSAISREVTGMAMIWTMEVTVRRGKQIIYSKAATHELEPLSYSGYLTKQRWLTEGEFTDIFLKLFDEALGLREPGPGVIKVGSFSTVDQTVEQYFPVIARHELAIAGAMFDERNSVYQLRNDGKPLQTYRYREGSDIISSRINVFSVILGAIFSGITGLDAEYDLKTKVEKRGRLEDEKGEQTRLRIVWLERRNNAPIGPETMFISPLTTELLDKDKNAYGSFVYFKRLHINNEELTKKNFRLTGTKGTLGVSDMHVITGKLRGRNIELVYPEQEGMVILYSDGVPVAALTMFNENADSRSFAGVRVSKNKKSAVGKSSFAKADINSKEVEVYSTYFSESIEPELKDDSVKLFILLFFSISQTLGDSD